MKIQVIRDEQNKIKKIEITPKTYELFLIAIVFGSIVGLSIIFFMN